MATTDTSDGARALADLPSGAVGTFEAGFRGAVIRPDDRRYDDARAVWNATIDRYPALIARCSGPADVVAAVRFAGEHDLPVAVRGGGHNVAGSAVCDGGVVVDLGELTGVRVDRAAGTVRAEGGATLGDVDRETQLFGLATPLGAVSQTGIAGLTLNGGYGHLSREHGLALDNLVSVDVVTADGRLLTASEDEHPDLFWGLRGGGGALGVVTSFEYRLHAVGPTVEALFSWFDGDDAPAVLEAFREWTADAPRQAGALAVAAHVPDEPAFPEERWGDPAVAVLGSARGDAADADVFAPLFEAATPVADLGGSMGFVDLQSMLDEDYPDGMRYYWKSIYLADLSDAVLDLLVRANEAAPSPLSTVDLWHLDGAVAEVPRDATAFWHRDKPYMLTVEANWEDAADDEANVRWAREIIAEVEDLAVGGGRYGNFPGYDEDPGRATYGDNYDRLVEIKTRYDPENLFRGNGTVEPRADGMR